MKKLFVLFTAAIIAVACTACEKKDDWLDLYESYLGEGPSISKSMVLFDANEFTPDNAYATVYFGLPNAGYEKTLETASQSYSHAFFLNQSSEEYYEKFVNAFHESGKDIEWELSYFEELDLKPLDSLSTISITDKPAYFVHHEIGTENYLSGKYNLEQVFIRNTGNLKSVKFTYSQRVKLPEEFFTEESGDISFIYSIYLYHADGHTLNSAGGPREHVDMHYEKKDGKIVLDNPILIDNKMKFIEILNFD